VVLHSILKRPEAVAAEKAAGKRRLEERQKKVEEKEAAKVEVMKRWESGELTEEEKKVYEDASQPVKHATMTGDLEETAARQCIANTVGMRTLQDWWECRREVQTAARTTPLGRRPEQGVGQQSPQGAHQYQPHQQPQPRQQRQQQ